MKTFSIRSFSFFAVSIGVLSSSSLLSNSAAANGSTGIGRCAFRVTKFNPSQQGAEDGSLEFVEVRVTAPTDAKTFGDCGVTDVTFVNGVDSCQAKASVSLARVKIPADGVAVLGSTASRLTPDVTTGTKGSWLENGPDFLVISHEKTVLEVLAYPNPSGDYPTCRVKGFSGEPTKLPVDKDATGQPETFLVGCDDGYRIANYEDPAFALRQKNACPDRTQGGAGGTAGAGGLGGRSSTTEKGGAATGGAGASATPSSVNWRDLDHGDPTSLNVVPVPFSSGGAGGNLAATVGAPVSAPPDISPPAAGCGFPRAPVRGTITMLGAWVALGAGLSRWQRTLSKARREPLRRPR